jgi:hypothetical protein
MFHFRRQKKPNKTDHNVPAQQKDFLCEACKSLNFRLEDFLGKTKGAGRYLPEPFRPVSIGTFDEVRRRRNCPLCRLVVRTEYHEQERFAGDKAWARGPIPESEKIIVKLGILAPLSDGDQQDNRVPVVL